MTLEDLERRVAHLEFLHGIAPDHEPQPPQTLYVREDTVETRGLRLARGDKLIFENGARLSLARGGGLQGEGFAIEGEGDIRWEHGSLPSTLVDVVCTLRPLPELGHYPFHWHHCHDDSRGTVFDSVRVIGSTNRAFVPHASHGITIRNSYVEDCAGTPFWWDLPTEHGDESNNSDDIVWEGNLVNGVKTQPGQNGFRNAGYYLGAGARNVCRNNAAENVAGTAHSSGFYWPAQAAGNPGGNVWLFEDNASFVPNSGAYIYQNGAPKEWNVERGQVENGEHLQVGFKGEQIDLGAYGGLQTWVGAEVERTNIQAAGSTLVESELGVVTVKKPNASGWIRVKSCEIDRLVISETLNHKAGVKRSISIEDCGDFALDVVAAHPSTTLHVDGVRVI